MFYFAIELSGLPAFLFLLLLGYVFVYLPLKFATILVSHAKQKADKLRLIRQRTIIAEYKAPNNLSPAEIGYLYDTKLNEAEVFATIVSLEQRGNVTIAENSGQLIVVETKTSSQPLKKFEEYTLKFLSNHKNKPITQKTLKRLNRQIKIVSEEEVQNQDYDLDAILRKELQAQGYLVDPKEQIRRSFLRIIFIVSVLYLLTLFIFSPNSIEDGGTILFFALFFAPLYFIVAIALYAASAKIAGQPWLGTPKLKRIWSDIEGYRYFIKQVELDNLQFDSKNTEGIVKNKALPYAIALGFNTGWRDKVK